MLTVSLPNELDETDLLAVVKIQGPDLPEKFHRFIVARAMQSEGYLKVVEAICRRARHLSQRNSHATIGQADIELAAAEVIPAPAAPVRPTSATPLPAPRQPVAVKRGWSAAPPSLQAPARSIRPAPAAPALEAPLRQTITAPGLEAPARQITPALATV
jgi:hypothetical protein